MSLQSIPESKDSVSEEPKISDKNGPKNVPKPIAGSPFIRAFGSFVFILGLIGLVFFLFYYEKSVAGSARNIKLTHDWQNGLLFSGGAIIFGMATTWFERSK
jgi:cbb3-type cytochrome oxidase subunit 3